MYGLVPILYQSYIKIQKFNKNYEKSRIIIHNKNILIISVAMYNTAHIL